MYKIKIPTRNTFVSVTNTELERMKQEGLIPPNTEIINLNDRS